MLKRGERICPCCGKPLELIPPTKELLPDRFGESQNGVEYYFYSRPRLRSYTADPRSNYKGGTHAFKLTGDLGKNAFYKRSPLIVTVNNTSAKLKRDGLSLFSYELVFFCGKCGAKLALNYNPFAIWGTTGFQMTYLVYVILWILPYCLGYEALSLWYFLNIAAALAVQLAVVGAFSLAGYLKTVRYSSNFVPTDATDNLFSPYIELRTAYGALNKRFMREGNVFSTEFGGEEFKLYLVKKGCSLGFHICGTDGEPERLLALIREKRGSGETVTLPLTFEGKPVGTAEVTEIF